MNILQALWPTEPSRFWKSGMVGACRQTNKILWPGPHIPGITPERHGPSEYQPAFLMAKEPGPLAPPESHRENPIEKTIQNRPRSPYLLGYPSKRLFTSLPE